MKAKSANGQGTIYEGKSKAGKKIWFVEVTVGYGPKGERRRTRRTCHSYKDARELLNKLVAQRQQGLLTIITGETVETFGEEWIKSKSGRVRTSTASDYLGRLYIYITPYLGSVRIIDLNARQIQNWMSKLKEQNMSPRTINGARQVLLAMCKHAMRQGLIHMNPVALVDPYSKNQIIKTQVREPWTLEEINAVLEASWDHDILECYLHLMLHTGMLPGEALGMLWEDIDIHKNQLHITGTLKEHRIVGKDGRGSFVLERNEPKTKSSRRTLPISEALKDVLLRQRMRGDLIKFHTDVFPKYVFSANQGGPISLANLRKSYTKLLKRNGIRYIRLHDIRHTVAFLSLNNAETPIEQTSQALGHTRIDTTKQIYAGYVPKYNDKFIADLSKYLPAPRQNLQGKHIDTKVKNE